MTKSERKPELNAEQREAAYCTENAVIAAGAGSGKTMVLAKRYAWLVTERNIPVQKILTLTFTKKAAAQMYRRIHGELSQAACAEGEGGRLAARALRDFSLARIQTLDSYCSSIVKQAANRYGISPDFAIDEERCGQLALDTSLPFLIANREHPVLKRLYPEKSPMAIAEDIFAHALFACTDIDGPPSDPKENVRKQFALILDEWKNHVGKIKNKLEELSGIYGGNEKCLPDLEPLLREYREGKAVFPEEDDLAAYFEDLLDTDPGDAPEWSQAHPVRRVFLDLIVFFLSIKGLNLNRGARNDPAKEPIKDLIKEFRDLFGKVSSLASFFLQAGLIYPLLTMISGLQNRYNDAKRMSGVLGFSDVARLARTILLEQKDIRQSEKETFATIMIDEFQDNNELQKDILFLVAEKPEISGDSVPRAKDIASGKLFFVGDEKQSIYRFRGADVSVFRKLKDELGSRELALRTNYRSAPRLIGAFNVIFGGFEFDPAGRKPRGGNADSDIPRPAVFLPESPELQPFEAAYTPLAADKQNGGRLVLCILDKADDKEEDAERPGGKDDLLLPAESEARFVAEKIRSLLDEEDGSGGRKYAPGDIAILFRSRTSQHLFEKHLMLLDVPYANEDLGGFFFGGPVNDLMSVLRLVAYPTDRAAYARMLGSPFAGLSLAGLTACLAVLDGENAEPFGEEPVASLDGEDVKKYRHGQGVYQKIFAMSRLENIASLVSELWFAEGYRYELAWHPRTAVLNELYDYLFFLAVRADGEESGNPIGLAAFTDYVQGLEKSGKGLKDIDIPLERSDAVHLMTIHKSKGLEFPVVFLCSCDKKGRNDVSDDVFETECGLALNPPLPTEFRGIKDIKKNYFWERSVGIEKEKRHAELRRLLYVGMTRAERELYLSGCLGISGAVKSKEGEEAAEDFPAKFGRYAEREMRKLSEAGDSGDTFFALCLKVFGGHDPNAADPFFEVEEIPQYGERYVRSPKGAAPRFSYDRAGLDGFLAAAESRYMGAEVMETPLVEERYFSPTSPMLKNRAWLGGETLASNFEVSEAYSGGDAVDVFVEVDRRLADYSENEEYVEGKFGRKDFGTVAHICIQALLEGQEAVIPKKLTVPLSDGDAAVFLDAGKKLAERFAASPLGKLAGESERRKSEFGFRSLINDGGNGFFVNGTIDLLFETDDHIYVVDFKTDGRELPEEHLGQLAYYRKAATDLFAAPSGKPCRVFLYYLRTGRAVEIGPASRGRDGRGSLNFRFPVPCS
ncbi:MAG: UvrD-helicase domain-containing protein [Treponema sp.]|nr:UvrD-helicase domain-containing protein [Treponema sp.]